MSDTTMLRVSTELRDKLKAKAKAEGRTLEWTANQAINDYLVIKQTANIKQNDDGTISPVDKYQPSTYTPSKHYKPTDDWGA